MIDKLQVRMTWMNLMNKLIFLIAIIVCGKTHASLITYSALSELKNNTANLVIEDWRSYPTHTILSNQTINGIAYQSENSLGEPIVTLGSNCRYGEYWCIDHLTESGQTRSFGGGAVTFKFENPINAFSISLIQGINDRIDGASIWDISFNTGQSAQVISNYTVEDSFGLGYLGISGITAATEVVVRNIRNDSNVVHSFSHIGYQTVAVAEPTSAVFFAVAMLIMLRMRK
jgi:hypothetical protein